MIDWFMVGFNALWIIGLGFLLTGISIAYYLKVGRDLQFIRVLRTPAYRVMIGLGVVFFCIGLAGNVSKLWEQVFWAILAIVFTLQTWLIDRKGNS